MKRIVIALFVLMTAASCVSRRSADQIISDRDSLRSVVAEKDSVINDIFFSLNQITENLATIKQRENIISSSVNNDEIRKQSTVQINDDIRELDKLLQDNKLTIARLQRSAAMLKEANIKIGSLEKLIKNLNTEINTRNTEILALKGELRSMDIKVEKLSEDVTALTTTVTTLEEDNTRLESEVVSGTERLNRAYYIVGSQKELLSKEIIYKSGFIGRTLRVNENRSLDSFTQVDIRDFDEVLIGKKDVVLVTTHPEESYEFVMSDKGIYSSLVITDKAKFWEYSKVLVISFK